MPVSALITTAGAANANAYCDVTFADQYHANRPPVGVTWALASPDTKSAAILWATILMDRLWSWNGWVTTPTQALLWPRQGMVLLSLWNYVDQNIIPLELQQATAEYARQLLVSDRASDSAIETLKLTSMKAGPVAFTFGEGVVAKPVPDTVFNLIPPLWGSVRSRNSGFRDLQRA